MNQATKYHSTNFMQIQGAVELLEKFRPKIKWDVNMKIVDIGCGPGNITNDYLLPMISNDAELLGIDISESMIKFAKTFYQDPRLNFENMDILDPKVIVKYANNFDMAFSFYCFHWIQNQRNLMNTLYTILKPGGQILFSVVVESLIYPLWEGLAASPKWYPYCKNHKNFVSPYWGTIDPVSDMVKLMQNEGFHVKECSLITEYFTFASKEIFYDWVDALNPFSKSIPKHLAEEYDQEWKRLLLDNYLVTYHETTDEISMRVLTLYAFVQKPY